MLYKAWLSVIINDVHGIQPSEPFEVQNWWTKPKHDRYLFIVLNFDYQPTKHLHK